MSNHVDNEQKQIFKEWWFWLIIVLIIIPYIYIATTLIKPKFEVTDYSITTDTTDYTSIQNTTSFDGRGIITTNDKKGIYLVALKEKLISGGMDTKSEYVTLVVVSNGKGEFSTYDYGNVGEITKPQYEFEIVGSQKIN